MDRFKNITIQQMEAIIALSEDAMNMVLDNEVEMGVIGKEPLNKKLASETLWKDRLALVVSKHHAMCKRSP